MSIRIYGILYLFMTLALVAGALAVISTYVMCSALLCHCYSVLCFFFVAAINLIKISWTSNFYLPARWRLEHSCSLFEWRDEKRRLKCDGNSLKDWDRNSWSLNSSSSLNDDDSTWQISRVLYVCFQIAHTKCHKPSRESERERFPVSEKFKSRGKIISSNWVYDPHRRSNVGGALSAPEECLNENSLNPIKRKEKR